MSISYLAPAAGHEQLEWLGGGVLHVLLDGQRAAGQPTMLRGAPARGFASPAAGWDLSQPWPAAQAVTPASMAAAAAATGQVVLGPPLQAGDRIPVACLGRRLAV
ncbi:MAG TPA: hypothetical protein VGH88_04160 [Streptosporangiaceae bacterium]|jgi:hypothetical protein